MMSRVWGYKSISGHFPIETSRFAFAQSPHFSSRVSKSNLDGAQEPEHAPEFIPSVLDILESQVTEAVVDQRCLEILKESIH